MNILRRMLIGTLLLTVMGCATAYYSTMEQFGVEKRDILVDRVKDARTEQADAQKVFTSALEEFRTLVNVDGGKLERKYDKLSASYDRADQQAGDVRERIASVESVGNRLFKEWRRELTEYESNDLRLRSQRQLEVTERDYKSVLAAMKRASAKMDPVLALYNDQVLFLKHNLNARAISSLDVERAEIEARVEELINEMNDSIAEADAFIAAMQ